MACLNLPPRRDGRYLGAQSSELQPNETQLRPIIRAYTDTIKVTELPLNCN